MVKILYFYRVRCQDQCRTEHNFISREESKMNQFNQINQVNKWAEELFALLPDQEHGLEENKFRYFFILILIFLAGECWQNISNDCFSDVSESFFQNKKIEKNDKQKEWPDNFFSGKKTLRQVWDFVGKQLGQVPVSDTRTPLNDSSDAKKNENYFSVAAMLLQDIPGITSLYDILPECWLAQKDEWFAKAQMIRDACRADYDFLGDYYLTYLSSSTQKSQMGQFFTDRIFARQSLEQCLFASSWQTSKPDIESKKDQIDQINIEGLFPVMDPACGSGNFLIAFLALLSKYSNLSQLIKKKTMDLNGLDRDAKLVFLARVNIFLFLRAQGFSIAECADIWSGIKLHWVTDSLSGVHDKPNGFGVVMGNPPYVGYNQWARSNSPFYQKIKSKQLRLNNLWGFNLHSISGNAKKYAPKPNLYAFFIAHALHLTKDKGRVVFIVPQTLLQSTDLDVVRAMLSDPDTGYLKQILVFQDHKFSLLEKRIHTSSLVLCMQKNDKANQSKDRRIADNSQSNLYVQVLTLANKEMDSDNVYDAMPQYTDKKFPLSVLYKYAANWLFLLWSDKQQRQARSFWRNSQSVDIYYQHETALKLFGSKFYFDKGVAIDRSKIQNISEVKAANFWEIPIFRPGYFELQKSNQGIQTEYIKIPQGSQGWAVWQQKYKIVWRYMNPNVFYFSRQPIVCSVNYGVIASDNLDDILYLLALLNCSCVKDILYANTKIESEKDFLWGIQVIKKYFRVPLRIDKNKSGGIKRKIIDTMQQILDSESNEKLDQEHNSILLYQEKMESLVKQAYFSRKSDEEN